MAGKSGRSRNKRKTAKKRSFFDVMMDLIVLGAFVVLAVVIGTIIWNNVQEKREEKASKPSATQEAEATPPSAPEGITVYTCVISSGEEVGDTEFEMIFDSNDMTYTENLRAGSEKNELDKGTYTTEGDTITTTSSETKDKETKYLLDGDYLLAAEQMYEGKVPDDAGEAFKGKFTYNIEDMGQTTIQFKEDGTYVYRTVTYAEEGSSQEDSVTTEKGTYKKDGCWIERTADSGEEKLAYYIYQGRITNAYYIKEQ